jgi:integrase
LLEAHALTISGEIKKGSFDYLQFFPNGNKAHLFRRQEDIPSTLQTVEGYFRIWIKQQSDHVRPHRLKDYNSTIDGHILKTRIGGQRFGKIQLSLLKVTDLKALQSSLKAKGLKATSVNGIIHSCLRAMLRDARMEGHLKVDLYDRVFFKPLPLTDVKSSIDPYTSEEREIILEAFRTQRPHYYPFVFFQFWQGARPSEAMALRREDIDLRYCTAQIHRSRVQGSEAGTKTVRSNREFIFTKTSSNY